MVNVKVFTDKQMDKQTGQKLYAPDPSMQGHKKVCEDIDGIGENDGNRHFLLFPIMFSSLPQSYVLCHNKSVVCKYF